MFRRRRPIRPRPRPFLRRRPLPPQGVPPQRPLLPPKVRQALAHANGLMADGQFPEAARIFEDLSKRAAQLGMPVRAADLALQASRAHFAADNNEAALELAKQALRMFVQGGRAGRIPLLLPKMTAALRNKGYHAQADRLEQEARQILEEMGMSLDEARQHIPKLPETRGSLPAKCDGCGAPLVPDEVDWHDTQTAECPYCGTIAKTE